MKQDLSAVQALVRAALCDVQPVGARLVVAVSGGADSLCLLHALYTLAPELGFKLHVAHLDHGLRPTALDDAAWVAALCARWALPCSVGQADVRAQAAAEGRGLEDAARQARYRFLAQVAAAVGAAAVAVGHTADDQAETVLLHLLRGAGPDGLAGMAAVSPWPLPDEPTNTALTLWRPLLSVSREQTVAYCAALGLAPRQDETNADPRYARNRLRLELLPLLRELNPAIVAALGRTAAIVRDEAELVRQAEDEAWAGIAVVEADAVRLARPAFSAQPTALQRRLLRRAARLSGLTQDLSWEHIAAALAVARDGRTGAWAPLPHGLRLRVDYDWLWVEPQDQGRTVGDWPAIVQPMMLAIPGEAALAAGWRVTAQVLARAALSADWAQGHHPLTAYLDAAALGERVALRSRRAGDWLAPLGMAGRQKVSDLLINAKVPAACRASLPLLTVNDEIAWVVGVRCDRRFAVTPETEQVCVLQALREEGCNG